MLQVIEEGIEYTEVGKSANLDNGTSLSQEQKNKTSYSHKCFGSLQTQHLTSEENTAHTQAGNMMLDYGYGVCHAVPGIKDLIFIMGLLQSHGTFRKLCIARQFMSLEICFKESLWDAGLILLHSVSQSSRGEQFP